MPEPEEHGRTRYREEWEPGAALARCLEEMPLVPELVQNQDLKGLIPHLEQALGELADLERRRGLSEREQTRAGALGILLEFVERAER